MDSENVSFMLSTEELFYSLRLLQLQNIPGLGEEPFGKVEDTELEKIMELAFRALVAKQTLILEPDKGFRLDKVVGTALSVCSAPEQMVVSTYQYQQNPIQVIYEYFTKDLSVNLDIPMSGVFKFNLRETGGGNLHSVLELVKEMPDAKNDGQESDLLFEITGREFEDFRQKLTNSIDEARATLSKKKIRPKHVSELISLFSSPEFRLTQQFFFRPKHPDETGQRVLSVAFANGVWCLIQGDGLSTDLLRVEKTTKDKICKAIGTAYSNLFAVGR